MKQREDLVSSEEKTSEIDLVELLGKLWRKRLAIVVVSVMFGIVGIIYSFTITPTYTAMVTFYPVQSNAPKVSSGLLSLVGSLGLSVGGETSTSYNIHDVLLSRTLCSKVVHKKWKTEKFVDSVSLIDYWGIDSTPGKAGKEEMDAIEELRERLEWVEEQETSLRRLEVSMDDPQLAADMANYISGLVQIEIQFYSQQRTKADLQFLDDRIAATLMELELAEEAVKDFEIKNHSFYLSPELKLQHDRLTRIRATKTAVYSELVKNKELTLLELFQTKPVILVLDEAIAPFHRTKPNRRMLLIIFGMLGLFLSCGTVLVAPALKTLFQSIKQQNG